VQFQVTERGKDFKEFKERSQEAPRYAPRRRKSIFLGIIGSNWPRRSMKPIQVAVADRGPPSSSHVNSGSFCLLELLELLELIELLEIYFRNFRAFLGLGGVK
jgi:hypothetical protein